MDDHIIRVSLREALRVLFLNPSNKDKKIYLTYLTFEDDKVTTIQLNLERFLQFEDSPVTRYICETVEGTERICIYLG